MCIRDRIITVIENGKYGFARIGYTQPLPQEGEMADWAYEEVTQAIQHGLVPSDLPVSYTHLKKGRLASWLAGAVCILIGLMTRFVIS